MEREVESQPYGVDAVAVRGLISFYLSLASQAIHKVKFNIPTDESHKDFNNCTKHVVGYTDLKQIALTEGLGQNSKVIFARRRISSTV